MKKIVLLGMLGLLGCGGADKNTSITVSRYPDQVDNSADKMSIVVQVISNEKISPFGKQQSMRMEQEGLAKAAAICSYQFGNKSPTALSSVETRNNNIITVDVVVRCR